MSYDRSIELELERERNRLDPPRSYRRRLSVKAFLKVAVPIVFGAVVATALLWYLIGSQWWFVFIVLATIVATYREYFKWSHNHITCHPTDGVLHIEDHSHPFILFFINGSPDDQIPLDDEEIDTPTLSFFDRWVFHCGSLIAGERTLKDLKNIDGLLAIQKYRESLKKESINLDKEQVSVQMAMLETLEAIGRDLATVVQFITSSRSEQTTSAPPVTYAQPIPITRRRPEVSAESDDAADELDEPPEK